MLVGVWMPQAALRVQPNGPSATPALGPFILRSFLESEH
jgi:hypothetical protein